MIAQFEQGALFAEKDWQDYIDILKSKTSPSSKEEVKSVLVSAVNKRIPKNKFGVFFSGGVDSSLIAFLCKKENADFICYSVGIKDSPDIIAAKKASQLLSLNWKFKEYSLEELEQLFIRTVKLFKNCQLPTVNCKPTVLSVGVAAVVIAAADLAKQDGITTLFGGLGSEEIFAGYERHATAKDINEECWCGLKNMWGRDFTRDYAVASALGISALVPFLDEDLIIKAMGLDGACKIKDGHKKHVLREIAESLGLPKEIAWRKKQAAQYGSKFDLAMEKISKKNGFKTKQEWIASLR